jgi:tetratricopeptide (TPR) repeat protein
MPDEVSAWAEQTRIPTYKIGTPDKNPMFLEKRVYQGSSGVVYPHPVIDRIFDDKEDKAYTAVYLENRYLKIMILPEIGGRLQMALDKTNGYHFIYYNRVIKPALVGLAGPWISGGIEFNWPQHHRPSTFDPLDWRIQEHEDGSKTVWCAEIESMFHTKGMHGFRLYPDRAVLEVHVQLYNRTSESQTFLWWANPAVSVHDEYQSVFPPDVHAVMDHGKRAVSSFPIATGIYYKVDYAPGTDISRYKNILVPTSYMAYHSDYDFMGDYDHRFRAGMLHVANHHIVPGKKQWTWGNGDFGHAWDRQLTDEDGPYIELMCGAYTDNQPDFSWIQPGEEKAFTQVFLPYKEIGPACNANQHAALSVEVDDKQAQFGVYLSSPRPVTVRLAGRGQILYEKRTSLAPGTVLLDHAELPAGIKPQDLTLSVLEGDSLLLAYSPLADDQQPEIPSPASAARPPEEIEALEELYLNGLHLEQYRHATYAPEPYYLEALRRDPGDSRCNNAMGLLLYRRGKFSQAEAYFRKAIQRLTLRNPNPYDGEPYYNLGLALKMQGRYGKALAAFHKAVWNAAWVNPACFELARLASREANYPLALEYLQRSLQHNSRHHKARHLKIALLRRTGLTDAARRAAQQALEFDPIEYGALWEGFLLDGDREFDEIVKSGPEVHIELALDYALAGLFEEAISLLERVSSDTMAAYTLGWVLAQAGRGQAAEKMFRRAAALPPDYCFPNRLEDVLILEAAQEANPQDGRAPYYLGNFWYAHHRYEEAISCWEKSIELDGSLATAHRNLGLAYFNKRCDASKGLAYFEKAFTLNPQDARVFFELDQLYKRLNRSPAERLTSLQRHFGLVEQRDDLMVEYVTLLNLLGRHDEAHQALMRRNFHPWEGGEGKVTGQYVVSLVEKARALIAADKAVEALNWLERAQIYPHNLGEGKLFGSQENNIFYYMGCAYQQLGETSLANDAFTRASSGRNDPGSVMYYNDQPPDMIFYQGLGLLKLDRVHEAQATFRKLVDYGTEHMDDEIVMDYFAVSLPDFLVFETDLNARNRLHCHYMLGLGYLGLGEKALAKEHLNAVIDADASHVGATLHMHLVG